MPADLTGRTTGPELTVLLCARDLSFDRALDRALAVADSALRQEQHERDCRRYTLLTADGWRVLRFAYDEVISRPAYVLACMHPVARRAPT